MIESIRTDRRRPDRGPLGQRALERLTDRIPVLEKPLGTVLGEPVRQRPGSRPLPPKPQSAVRLMTLNIAHGRRRVPHQALVGSGRLRQNLDAVARLVDNLETDVVALQEADGPSAWSGNFDHVAALASAARFPSHYRGDHNPFRIGRHALASGTALMARWPLRQTQSHRFGSSWRCTKGFVVGTVEVPAWGGQAIDVVSVHLDFLAPHLRRRQIDAMVEQLETRRGDRPLVLLGDLNACWRHEPATLAMLGRRLGLRAFEPEIHRPTYPAYRPRRRLDWVLLSPELRFAAYRRVPVKLSDHLGVVVDLASSDAA